MKISNVAKVGLIVFASVVTMVHAIPASSKSCQFSAEGTYVYTVAGQPQAQGKVTLSGGYKAGPINQFFVRRVQSASIKTSFQPTSGPMPPYRSYAFVYGQQFDDSRTGELMFTTLWFNSNVNNRWVAIDMNLRSFGGGPYTVDLIDHYGILSAQMTSQNVTCHDVP